MKTLLITGASGFIGRACFQKLQELDFDKIFCVSRKSDNPVLRADLLDPKQRRKLVESIKPTHILHAAWEVTPRVYMNSPLNNDWLAASLDLAEKFAQNGGQYFLGIGTSAEYLPGDMKCREDLTEIRPQTLYGQSKASFWNKLKEMDLKTGWARIFVPYGPGDPQQRLIPTIISKIKMGQTVETTHGRQVRDFIHIDDIATYCQLMMKSEAQGAYNTGTGKEVTIRALISYISERLGHPELVKFDVLALAETEPLYLVADMSRSIEKMGYIPKTDLFQWLDRELNCETTSKARS